MSIPLLFNFQSDNWFIEYIFQKLKTESEFRPDGRTHSTARPMCILLLIHEFFKNTVPGTFDLINVTVFSTTTNNNLFVITLFASITKIWHVRDSWFCNCSNGSHESCSLRVSLILLDFWYWSSARFLILFNFFWLPMPFQIHFCRFGPSETFISRRRDAQLSDNGALECLVRFAPFAKSSATDPAAFVQLRATTEPPIATDEEQQLSSFLVEALSPAIRLVDSANSLWLYFLVSESSQFCLICTFRNATNVAQFQCSSVFWKTTAQVLNEFNVYWQSLEC